MFFFDTCNAVAAREDWKPKYWRLGRRHHGLSLTLWRHTVKRDILNMACDCWLPCSCVYWSLVKPEKSFESFSAKQRLHLLDLLLYGLAEVMVDQWLYSFSCCLWVSTYALRVQCCWRIFCFGAIVCVVWIVVSMYPLLILCSSFLLCLHLSLRARCRLG